MINHVVLFKMKNFSSLDKKQEVLSNFRSGLLALKGIIPELKYIEVGLNYDAETVSYDVCLISKFDNLDDLVTYSTHPEHLKVTGYIKEYVASRAAVDYEA